MTGQELLALGIVALVVGVYAWRRRARHASTKPGCGDCASAAKPRADGETTVHFYRRRG
jgi:nitrate/TMAO reductase-like tetraheme cytochrome c subunit